jgi:hypothetical protein
MSCDATQLLESRDVVSNRNVIQVSGGVMERQVRSQFQQPVMHLGAATGENSSNSDYALARAAANGVT